MGRIHTTRPRNRVRAELKANVLRWLIRSAAAGVLLSAMFAGSAHAATGDLLRSITAANPENCGVNVGIAFDGQHLLVSCVSGDGHGSTKIDYINPSDGSLASSLTVNLPGVAAMAYDAGRGKLWVCDSPTGGNSPGSGTEVFLIDPNTGLATDEFPTNGCWDGLAYDASDDTLWVSPDQSDTIYHYTSSGALIGSHSGLGNELGGFGNSGIAVGGPNLYLSNADGGTIYSAPKDFSSPPTPVANEPGQHMEDMECDSVTFAPNDAMWVIGAFNRTVNAYEIPANSCGVGGQNAQQILTVAKSGSGGGTVTSSPAGIDCGPTCSSSFPTGTIVTLTAAPASGSTFTGWSGGGCSGTGTCQVSLTTDVAVTATFSAVVPVPVPPGPVPVAPAVVTGTPAISGSSGASFAGSVNPDGLPTTAHFEYGLDRRYATAGASGPTYTQATPPQGVGSDTSSHAVSASVGGLVPNALYHVRLVATNSAGTTFGPDMIFTTSQAPAPGAPALGRTFNISPVRGLVLIKVHGVFIPLTQVRQIPRNTVINALHGTLKVITAAAGGHGASDAAAKGKKHKSKTQTGTFGGAIFKIKQAHSGLATLALVESAFRGAPSYSQCKRGKSADASVAALSSRTLQLLHASAHGKFRTSGRYSAATVRGTRWTIADKCNGTLTRDITDSVAVTDFVRHKTIILHAGQIYLARARP
jgi:hypothetical protein